MWGAVGYIQLLGSTNWSTQVFDSQRRAFAWPPWLSAFPANVHIPTMRSWSARAVVKLEFARPPSRPDGSDHVIGLSASGRMRQRGTTLAGCYSALPLTAIIRVSTCWRLSDSLGPDSVTVVGGDDRQQPLQWRPSTLELYFGFGHFADAHDARACGCNGSVAGPRQVPWDARFPPHSGWSPSTETQRLRRAASKWGGVGNSTAGGDSSVRARQMLLRAQTDSKETTQWLASDNLLGYYCRLWKRPRPTASSASSRPWSAPVMFEQHEQRAREQSPWAWTSKACSPS